MSFCSKSLQCLLTAFRIKSNYLGIIINTFHYQALTYLFIIHLSSFNPMLVIRAYLLFLKISTFHRVFPHAVMFLLLIVPINILLVFQNKLTGHFYHEFLLFPHTPFSYSCALLCHLNSALYYS